MASEPQGSDLINLWIRLMLPLLFMFRHIGRMAVVLSLTRTTPIILNDTVFVFMPLFPLMTCRPQLACALQFQQCH